jgi:hypothetical protein
MRRTFRATARACVGAFLLAAVGCGDVDGGSQSFAGTVVFTDPGGGYRMRLLEPPWIAIPLDGENIFVVPPSDATTSSDLTVALFTLHVGTASGTPAQLATTDVSAGTLTRAAGSELPVEASVVTAFGGAGFEVSWEESPGTFERDAFLATPGQSTYRLEFTARGPIADDAMITQMILGFEAL